MKKSLSFLLVFTACLQSMTMMAQSGERLTFGVISDIHIENNVGEGAMVKVPKALKNLTSHAKLDALAVVGDITNNGRADQYELLTSVFTDATNFSNPVGELLFMLGNHDNFDSNGKSNYQEGLKTFNGGQPYPYHQYKVIKGYPFITLSEFSGDSQDYSNAAIGTNAYPVDNQELLAAYLQQAVRDCPGKPIFIFTHVPPRWSVYGSWPELENGNGWAMKVLNPILNKYPQAVVFSGHSHYPLGDPRSIHQGANPKSAHENYYTVINTASTTYSEIHPGAVDAGIHPEGYAYVTEGMILTELDNGDIEIRRYDTYRDLEIGADRRWVLKAPFDGTMFEYADIRDKNDNPNGRKLRDGLPAPVWPAGTELALAVESSRATLTIPQATDDECVFRYRIRLSKDGLVLAEHFIFSQFYLMSDMPQTLTYVLNDLKSSSQYTVEVVALDSYDNASTALTATFTTPAASANVLTEAEGRWTFEDGSDLLKASGGSLTLQPVVAGSKTVSIAESLAATGIVAAGGAESGDGAIYVPKGSGLKMVRQDDATLTSNWTLMWYVMLPNAGPYASLLQTRNANDNDGDLFIYGNQVGIRDFGGYFGTIVNEAWHRIVFTNRGNRCYLYVDGELLHDAAGNSRWEIDPWGLYVFIDDDGEMNDAYLTELVYWDRGLSDDEIRILSGLDVGGDEEVPYMNVVTQKVTILDNLEFSITVDANVAFEFTMPDWIEPIDVTPFKGKRTYTFRAQPMEYEGKREDVIYVTANDVDEQKVAVEQISVAEGEVPEALGHWTFDNPSDPMENLGTVSTLEPAHKGEMDAPYTLSDMQEAGIEYVEGPTADNLAISVPKDAFLLLTTNTGADEMRTYSILYDVMIKDINGFKSLLQCDLTNTQDAGIFFNNAQVGRFVIGYGGEFQTDIWYRLIIVVKDGCTSIFVNGQKVVESNTPYDFMIMKAAALLFADNNGEEGLVNVADIRFWDLALSDAMAAQLGDPYNEVDELFLVDNSTIRLIDKTEFSINVNANVPFTFSLPDWIEAVDVECESGAKDYRFQAKEMTQEGSRTGTIIVTANHFDPVEIPVKQVKLGDDLPQVHTIWTFDDASNLLAGQGDATLQAAFRGDEGPEIVDDLSAVEMTPIEGPKAGNGAIGVNENAYLWLTNNVGVNELKDYAILMDIRPSRLDVVNALYQNNILNNTDAGLYIKNEMLGLGGRGLDYHGELISGKWHRVIFSVKDGFITLYLDGLKIAQSTAANSVWTMMPEVLLFADNNDEEIYTEVAEIRFWDVPLNDANAKALGAVDQDWEGEPFVEPTAHWTFDDASNLMAGTGKAVLKGSVHSEGMPVAYDDPAEASIVPTQGPSADDGAITVPFGSSLQMAHNESVGTLNSFTIMMDVKFQTLSGYNAIYQGNMDNADDAGLFTNGTAIGINWAGLGYAGKLEDGQWHRIVFMVEDNVISVYVNGVKLSKAKNPSTDRWVMHELCYFFCDENGEEHEVYISDLRFWNDVIPAEQIQALGGVDSLTGIAATHVSSSKLQQGIFNLSGQRLSKPQRGLNIIDGELILVK